ncbi:3-keto-5-aminohexanoate cleavage protein [Prevotella sp. 10(H)]|uniref:3-keto-5-aminohexanoate cleavage protein n=1 Tax=Prevotella sp. 10(H) TaxID=1158294 RepID=UPI0004A6F7B6|nr:3-keto-5-aminohexanoate cleavage protein [Prevotella sp. 10(H)]
MIIKAALNGGRTKIDNPNVPVTVEEILNEAVQSVIAGAQEIHFHVRDKNGIESLNGQFVAEQMSLLKRFLPQIPIGISTGEWMESDVDKRKQLIKEWTVLPDFVSVNISEDNFEGIIEILLEKGISIEAGISTPQEVIALVKSGLLKHCFRILIEPDDLTLQDALNNVSEIEKIILPVLTSHDILLHGYNNDTCWGLVEKAFERKYSTRIGFEDTVFIDENIKATSNAELIKKALSLKQTIHDS